MHLLPRPTLLGGAVACQAPPLSRLEGGEEEEEEGLDCLPVEWLLRPPLSRTGVLLAVRSLLLEVRSSVESQEEEEEEGGRCLVSRRGELASEPLGRSSGLPPPSRRAVPLPTLLLPLLNRRQTHSSSLAVWLPWLPSCYSCIVFVDVLAEFLIFCLCLSSIHYIMCTMLGMIAQLCIISTYSSTFQFDWIFICVNI